MIVNLCALLMQAQEVEVIFEETHRLTPELLKQIESSPHAALIKAQMKQQKKTYRLSHVAGKSEYVHLEKAKDDIVKGYLSTGRVYKDFSSATVVTEENLLGRLFLVTEKDVSSSWDLVDESCEIEGYLCKKAISKDKKTSIWYTTEVDVKDGPLHKFHLPGLVLKVENPSFLIMAKQVKHECSTSAIKVPQKGKKLSREKFNRLRDKKMKSLNNMGGGNIKVIRL